MSPRLTDMVRSAHEGQHLIVTGPHTQWMEKPEEEQVYSPEAIEFVAEVLRRQHKTPRAGRFSPSSIGKCPRRLALGYAGAPQLPMEAGSSEIVDHGSWTHLKWQAEGLSMGYMDDAEVWIEDKDLQIGGSQDGVLYEGSGFELKSAAPSVYSRQVLEARAPHEEYLDQVTVYMMLSGTSWFSIVYEDRAYGNFHEFRIGMDAKREAKVVKLLRSLISMIESDQLPPQYEECSMRVGKTFRNCPYRKVCGKVNSVSEIMDASDETRIQWTE